MKARGLITDKNLARSVTRYEPPSGLSLEATGATRASSH